MSKVEVDQITQQSGTTLTVGGGACKTAAIDATTVTIGRSGGTVTLTSGATQSGFGRTGTVDWQTGSIKTATFTAANGEGYFCNTSGGAFTVNLPSSPSVGDIVAIKDYGSSFATNNLTIGRGGSNLNGSALDSVRSTDNESLTLVYADATKGWLAVEEGTGFLGETFITATGGTITTSGNDKIHTFTGPGTFTVCSIASCSANNLVSYLVVAGGAGGGSHGGAGGGAGGFREVKSPVTPYTASPLDGYPSAPNRITVTAQAYPITVGSGGSASPNQKGGNGNNSVFSTITSAGGGGGGGGHPSPNYQAAANGGSGGGAGCASGTTIGNGNTPPTTPPQGNNGGNVTSPFGTGGGGGATAVGADGPPSNGGAGGAGATTSIIASPTAYAGGGGGSKPGVPAGGGGAGGTGGGGLGGNGPGPAGNLPSAGNGTDNTGGGGGGNHAGPPSVGGNGGSGIVIIRYKFQ